MRRRLLLSTCLIALAAILVLGVPLGVAGSEVIRQRADGRAERRADSAALRLASAQARGRPLTGALVSGLIGPHEAIVVTLPDGRRRTFGHLPSGSSARIAAGDDQAPLRVSLVTPARSRNDDIGAVWLAVGGATALALLAAIVLALAQSRRLAAPLEQLARRVPRVGHPDYDDRPVAGRVREIDQLQQSLHEADRRIGELVRREREFSSNASHQLRTPLTGLRMRIEELGGLASSDAARHEVGAALADVDRLSATIEQLEALARQRPDGRVAIDAGRLVGEHVARAWSRSFAAARRELRVDAPPGTTAATEPESLRQILDVLLANALAHGKGAVDIDVGGDDRWARIRVRDAGDGLADDEAIFTRGTGRGTGIGLAVARELARRSGGDLRLTGRTPTCFEALLPGGSPVEHAVAD